MTNRTRLMRALLVAGCLALSMLLLAGCGGGDDEEDATPTVEEEEDTTPTPEEVTGDSVQVDQSFWHHGFKVTLGEATLVPDDFGTASVTIDATFENLGATDYTFDSDTVLTSGGNSYTEHGFDEELPQVPGELSGAGTIEFDVDEDFTFDDAVMIVGTADENQATVPLTPTAGELVSLEPQQITATGAVTAGAVTANVTGAELRADLPNSHQEIDDGKLALTVFFSVDVGSGIQIGQGVFQSPNVTLKLPDGTAVAVRSDGVSGVNELLQGREGTTIGDLSVRFEVNDPPAGGYAFVVRGAYGPGGADVAGELAFQVP